MCSERGRDPRRRRTLLAVVVAAVWLTGGSRAASPMFYPDDPIAADNDRAFDASGATPIEGSNGYDFAEHTFLKPGEHSATRAVNVNTIDEVPDSTWFTNRIGRGPMPLDDIVRGPNPVDHLNVDGWPIV